MSLTLTGVPQPHDQLRSLQQELFNKNRQLNEKDGEIQDLRDQLREARQAARANELAISNLRQILSPLHAALGMVFGEIEASGIAAETAAPFRPQKSAVWEDWKQKMGSGSAAARIIDMLHLHGELTQDQIRIHLGTNRMQTVYDAVSKLNKAQIINKNGGKISLKEL